MNLLQTSPFLERLLRFLIPYFTSLTPDLEEARAEALETLACYGARTRAELLNAAQIIVFGMATLETLGEAKSTGMSPSMRLRFRGCANNLSRSGQKTEQTLARRLAAEPPRPTPPAQLAEPLNDIDEPQAEAILQQAQAQIGASRIDAGQMDAGPIEADQSRPSAGHPSARPPASMQHPHAKAAQGGHAEQEHLSPCARQLWSEAIMQALSQMGMPVQSIDPAPAGQPPHNGLSATP